ncbi:MAG: TusE/DsrC/DsvC family sulfur relay protein [Bacteroidota bacterium]
MTLTIDSVPVEVNDEGYFLRPEQWTLDMAHEMARSVGIELTEKHIEILHYLRNRYFEDTPLTLRRVGKSGLVTIKEFYGLFPGGPLKVSSRIAGIPKPASCV